jgi:23S rRNA pseudouridine1911/1915/1917 synthase
MLLLDYLLENYKDLSRNKIKTLLTKGAVTVDGEVRTKYDFPVSSENLVQIVRNKNAAASRADNNMRHFATIEYEDQWLIVVNKKTGVLSVPTGHHGFCMKTLLDEYLERKGEHRTVHIVHRLDKETSGLMLFAKSRQIQQIFTDNWHEIITDRRYYAVTDSIPRKENDTIKSWLYDDSHGHVHSSPTDNGGKFAVTHYKTLQVTPKYALLDVKLETGRKNQIRVHLQDIGCPVVGDAKYGYSTPIGRLGLHAYRLCFTHPITHKAMSFETPIPSTFKNLMEKE